MKRFVAGESRSQATLFPELLDDFVTEDKPVRAIAAFIDALNLRQLGFKGIDPHATGRPAYHPAVLLKIYLYGYLNRLQSSRRLEREAQRNVELMWLTERLAPDFKTIADFRKHNGKAIQATCRDFVVICRCLGLFSQSVMAIDGSKFKAVNNRDRNFTLAKMKRRAEEIDKSIERYLRQLDAMDQGSTVVTEAQTTGLKEKIASLTEEVQQLQSIEIRRTEAPDQQISLTDPDARSMTTRGTGIVGYNI